MLPGTALFVALPAFTSGCIAPAAAVSVDAFKPVPVSLDSLMPLAAFSTSSAGQLSGRSTSSSTFIAWTSAAGHTAVVEKFSQTR
jgi:hypothetical protein